MSDTQHLRYSPQHLWVLVVGESARVGVTERFGGTIDAVELPKVGESIHRGEPLGWVSHNGAKRPLVAPISGTVVLVNELLTTQAGAIVTDPYGGGWLIECQMSYDETLETVVDADAYRLLV